MKKTLLFLFLATALTATAQDTLRVATVRHAGPFALQAPAVLDSLDGTQTKYSKDKLIDTPLSVLAADRAPVCDLATLRLTPGTLNLVTFSLDATTYVKGAALRVEGAKHYKVYADGSEAQSLSLKPGHHTVAVKFMADSTAITLSVPAKGVTATAGGKRAFTLADNLATRVSTSAALSPSGRWCLSEYRWYDATNKVRSTTMLLDLKTGQKRQIKEHATWLPRTDRYYYTEHHDGRTQLVTADPATGATATLCQDVPEEYFIVSPTEDFAIMMKNTEGPKKEDGVFEILHPDDRQPTWRYRYALSRLDFKTGFVQPLTHTWHPISVQDISADGRTLLFSVSKDSLTQRPTTRSTYYMMNLATLSMRQIVKDDGFLQSAIFAGDTTRVVLYGSTEAFAGVGKRVPAGATPNMYDYHLYLLDTRSLSVTPLTADEQTSIESMEYSPADGSLYYTAQHCDSTLLYRLDLKTLRSRVVAQPLEDVNGFSVAQRGGNIALYGSSATVPYEVWSITTPATKPRATRILAPNAELFADIKLGTVKPWKFHSQRGYDVTGFYFLPADFDAAKKYPVIVHYYGGCSPTSRRFGNGSHYPAHYWNAQGYITFIVNPSGASGFGQEWASRHVNTMGEGPAEDIIDATRQFAKDVPQVDAAHIGCVSASYGGFMTQYMLTKDNPFACGISHAGISDHSSYWGEGYWGYSYSEVSAANSYPWTRKDLYVDRSPLYNADKITKPLLFTHGTADTNVPIGESIQMYTALRLLGRTTAFVEVEGENHGIMDPVKRVKWIDTMMAWFQRFLKDDASWWDATYTPKKL